MKSPTRSWTELSIEPMSLEAIKALHLPTSHFRVSPNRHDAGIAFPGTTTAGRIYVMSGHCMKSMGEWRAELEAGSFVDFPAGDYKFETFGDTEVRLVYVWFIPERYRPRGSC